MDEISKWSKKGKGATFIQAKLLKMGLDYPTFLIEEELTKLRCAQGLIESSKSRELSLWIKVPLLLFCVFGFLFIPLPLPKLLLFPFAVTFLVTLWYKV